MSICGRPLPTVWLRRIIDWTEVRGIKTHLEILHARRIDDGVEESLQDYEAVDCDADANDVSAGRIFERKNAILTVDDVPDDGRHPADDKRTNN